MVALLDEGMVPHISGVKIMGVFFVVTAMGLAYLAVEVLDHFIGGES